MTLGVSTMSRERIDPESRVDLDAYLKAVPGGFGSIADIVDRRIAIERRLDELTADLPFMEVARAAA